MQLKSIKERLHIISDIYRIRVLYVSNTCRMKYKLDDLEINPLLSVQNPKTDYYKWKLALDKKQPIY